MKHIIHLSAADFDTAALTTMNTPLLRFTSLIALSTLSLTAVSRAQSADNDSANISEIGAGDRAVQRTWAGPMVEESGWIYTGETFLGWAWTSPAANQPWLYSIALDTWVFLPPSYLTESGAWVHIHNFGDLEWDTGWAEYNWVRSDALDTWFYVPDYSEAITSSWVYAWDTAEPAEPPAEIVITPEHVANPGQEDISERYANAYQLTATEIAEYLDYDEDFLVSSGPEGITFTSIASSFEGNRFIRIGYGQDAGLLDFTALDGASGTIRVDAHMDLDLSQTSNGFYVRLKSGSEDVGTSERRAAEVVETNVILQSYLTNAADNAYLEITLPWQGSVTIKGVYLYMESEVTGFADMEETITGGTGATEANTHVAGDAEEFHAALAAVRESGQPSIIQVTGAITYEDWVALTGDDHRQIPLGSDIENLSIVGVGNGALFDGVGFELHGRNIIMRNLTIRYVLGRDAITINDAQYVWIDHNTLYNEDMSENPDKDKFDELISLKNKAQSVIVSWNHIHDSHKTILVGSNDAVDAIPDRKLIMHHNWIHDCGSRIPLYRGGYAHIYNNYIQNVDSAINARTGSKILIENNYFENVDSAIGYWFDDTHPSGLWEIHGNKYVEVDSDAPTESTTDVEFAGNYEYTLDPTENVPAIVMEGAGAGKL